MFYLTKMSFHGQLKTANELIDWTIWSNGRLFLTRL